MLIIGQVGKERDVEQFFEAEFKEELLQNWNIQEGDSCSILTTDKPNTFQNANFGLIPFWSTKRNILCEAMIDGGVPLEPGKPIKNRIIQNTSFRKSIRETRCIIPADYFISVEKGAAYLFFNQDRTPLSIAAVYDRWKPNMKDKELYTGFSILTYPSYGIFTQLGIERLPFLIEGGRYKKWLKASNHLLDVTNMMYPYPDDLLNGYEVDFEKVNQKVNERALIIPKSEFIRPYKNHASGLASILRSNRYKKGAIHNLEDQEQKVWREK